MIRYFISLSLGMVVVNVINYSMAYIYDGYVNISSAHFIELIKYSLVGAIILWVVNKLTRNIK